MLQPQMINEEIYEKSSVKICALVDSNGTPNEVAYIASSLVEEGFTAIKLKVSLGGTARMLLITTKLFIISQSEFCFMLLYCYW